MCKTAIVLSIVAVLPSQPLAQTFTDTNISFDGVVGATAAWGDYDNDGDLDVIVTGDTTETSSGRIAHLYQNQNGAFVVVETGIIGVEAGSVDWGDYDNDGDLDLLVTGL